MNQRLLLALFLLFDGFLAACHKDRYKPHDKFDAVGTKYTYMVNDSLSGQTYPVTVNIVARRVITGKAMNVWIYHYPTGPDTNYVYSTPDSIIFYDHTGKTIKNAYYLPLAVGRKWRNYYVLDTCKVVSQGTINAGNITYNDAYQIEEQAGGYNYYLHRTEWFLPGTGMLKMTKHVYDLGPADNQSWELVKIE